MAIKIKYSGTPTPRQEENWPFPPPPVVPVVPSVPGVVDVPPHIDTETVPTLTEVVGEVRMLEPGLVEVSPGAYTTGNLEPDDDMLVRSEPLKGYGGIFPPAIPEQRHSGLANALAAAASQGTAPWDDQADKPYTIMEALNDLADRKLIGKTLHLMAVKNGGATYVVRSYDKTTHRATLLSPEGLLLKPVLGIREASLYTPFISDEITNNVQIQPT